MIHDERVIGVRAIEVLLYLTDSNPSEKKAQAENTVESRYLEFQLTLWNASRYPYLDISD